MPKEITYFENDDVVVTTTRFITPDRTYYINGITSVGTYEVPPNNSLAWFLIIFGFILCIPAIIGLIMLFFAKGKFFVTISTAGGEKEAYWNHDWPTVRKIVKAIDRAILEQNG